MFNRHQELQQTICTPVLQSATKIGEFRLRFCRALQLALKDSLAPSIVLVSFRRSGIYNDYFKEHCLQQLPRKEESTDSSEDDTARDHPFQLMTSVDYITKLTPDVHKPVTAETVPDTVSTQSDPSITAKTAERGRLNLKRYAAIEAYDAEMERLEYLKYSNEHSESVHGRQRKHKEEWSPTFRRVLPSFNVHRQNDDSEESA